MQRAAPAGFQTSRETSHYQATPPSAHDPRHAATTPRRQYGSNAASSTATHAYRPPLLRAYPQPRSAESASAPCSRSHCRPATLLPPNDLLLVVAYPLREPPIFV